MFGLIANLRNVYEIRSNSEAEYGRADILMIPKTRKYKAAYIIEFRSITDSADAQRKTDDTRMQINEKEYEAVLKNAGVSLDTIRRLAIILLGKKCWSGLRFVPDQKPDFTINTR